MSGKNRWLILCLLLLLLLGGGVYFLSQDGEDDASLADESSTVSPDPASVTPDPSSLALADHPEEERSDVSKGGGRQDSNVAPDPSTSLRTGLGADVKSSKPFGGAEFDLGALGEGEVTLQVLFMPEVNGRWNRTSMGLVDSATLHPLDAEGKAIGDKDGVSADFKGLGSLRYFSQTRFDETRPIASLRVEIDALYGRVSGQYPSYKLKIQKREGPNVLFEPLVFDIEDHFDREKYALIRGELSATDAEGIETTRFHVLSYTEDGESHYEDKCEAIEGAFFMLAELRGEEGAKKPAESFGIRNDEASRRPLGKKEGNFYHLAEFPTSFKILKVRVTVELPPLVAWWDDYDRPNALKIFNLQEWYNLDLRLDRLGQFYSDEVSEDQKYLGKGVFEVTTLDFIESPSVMRLIVQSPFLLEEEEERQGFVLHPEIFRYEAGTGAIERSFHVKHRECSIVFAKTPDGKPAEFYREKYAGKPYENDKGELIEPFGHGEVSLRRTGLCPIYQRQDHPPLFYLEHKDFESEKMAIPSTPELIEYTFREEDRIIKEPVPERVKVERVEPTLTIEIDHADMSLPDGLELIVAVRECGRHTTPENYRPSLEPYPSHQNQDYRVKIEKGEPAIVGTLEFYDQSSHYYIEVVEPTGRFGFETFVVGGKVVVNPTKVGEVLKLKLFRAPRFGVGKQVFRYRVTCEGRAIHWKWAWSELPDEDKEKTSIGIPPEGAQFAGLIRGVWAGGRFYAFVRKGYRDYVADVPVDCVISFSKAFRDHYEVLEVFNDDAKLDLTSEPAEVRFLKDHAFTRKYFQEWVEEVSVRVRYEGVEQIYHFSEYSADSDVIHRYRLDTPKTLVRWTMSEDSKLGWSLENDKGKTVSEAYHYRTDYETSVAHVEPGRYRWVGVRDDHRAYVGEYFEIALAGEVVLTPPDYDGFKEGSIRIYWDPSQEIELLKIGEGDSVIMAKSSLSHQSTLGLKCFLTVASDSEYPFHNLEIRDGYFLIEEQGVYDLTLQIVNYSGHNSNDVVSVSPPIRVKASDFRMIDGELRADVKFTGFNKAAPFAMPDFEGLYKGLRPFADELQIEIFEGNRRLEVKEFLLADRQYRIAFFFPGDERKAAPFLSVNYRNAWPANIAGTLQPMLVEMQRRAEESKSD